MAASSNYSSLENLNTPNNPTCNSDQRVSTTPAVEYENIKDQLMKEIEVKIKRLITAQMSVATS